MNVKRLIIFHLLFVLLFSFISHAANNNNEAVTENYDNTKDILSSIRGKKDLLNAPKLTHVLQTDIDLTKEPPKDCTQIYKELKETVPLTSKEYFSLSYLYCLQPKNPEGINIATLLRIYHVVESSGTEASSKELNLFLNNFKNSKLFGQEINYYPVDYFIKHRVIRATHSFVNFHHILEKEFSTPVKNYAHFLEEGDTIMSKIDLKNKENFLTFFKNETEADGPTLKAWSTLFNDPYLDVISIYARGVEAVVKILPENYMLKNLLNESRFIDTRFDEFTSEDSYPPNNVMQPICLKIDTNGTEHEKFPNKAYNVNDMYDHIVLHSGEEACFQYGKSYYMQHFLHQAGNSIWYGTTCRFLPYFRHQGKTVSYIGEHGQYKCPVE